MTVISSKNGNEKWHGMGNYIKNKYIQDIIGRQRFDKFMGGGVKVKGNNIKEFQEYNTMG